ncbi:lysoplasmalogenase [Planomonospora venezuelensis]|uniref:Putative membrane protein YhhN n=1 Tax=Planomonospora venezuelensis TaxID=1999 RepID=A0A841CYW8_PLAVE|nr:lysoplasmalogenase [Planomonospora venezuelensis]MBB5963572.1 putative membrane protein YhhN [Planomonospora venezuelensis]GIN02091.1 hypothetical protein Pve01_37490 [Planomonospora venezuelensis]
MLLLYAGLALADLLAVLLDIPALEWASKPLLAPVLAVYLLRADPRQRLLPAGLAFAAAGDVALLMEGRIAFAAGMACFLAMQVCYIAAFARAGAFAVLRARPWVPGVYLLVWLAASVALWDALGGLRIPIVLYGLALIAMAAAASGVGRVVAAGGALFAVSDLLIGLGVAGTQFPGRGLVVMATYVLAQVLIVCGFLRAVRQAGPAEPAAPAPRSA